MLRSSLSYTYIAPTFAILNNIYHAKLRGGTKIYKSRTKWSNEELREIRKTHR